MSHPADPALVERCAALARQHAAELRVRATRLGTAAHECPWAGPAARAFRGDVDGLLLVLRTAALRLDGAADGFARYAMRVRP